MDRNAGPTASRWGMDTGAYWSVLVMAFSMPLSRAAFNLASAALVLTWLLGGNFARKWACLKTDAVAWGVWFFVLLALCAATYSPASPDLAWGQTWVYGKLLLIPLILSTITRYEQTRRVWYALLLGLGGVLAAVMADIWLDIPGTRTYDHPGALNRGVFTHHIVQGMHLSLLSIFCAYECRHARSRRVQTGWAAVSFLAAGAALLVNGSRAGHLALLAGWGAWVFFSLRGLHRALGIALLCLATVFAYQSADFFKTRVDAAVHDFTQYQQDQEKTSGGARLAAWEISAALWREHPWLGVGLAAYKQEATPRFKDPSLCGLGVCEQPHNQWMLVLAEQGVVGVLALLLLCLSVLGTREWNNPYLMATWASLWTVSLFDSSLLIRHQAFTYVMGLTAVLLVLRHHPKSTI